MNDYLPRLQSPSRHRAFALLLVLPALFGLPERAALAQPAAPAAARIIVPAAALSEPDARRALQRRIARAAGRLCVKGGLAGSYRNAASRCRRQALADADRQLTELRRRAARDGRARLGEPQRRNVTPSVTASRVTPSR